MDYESAALKRRNEQMEKDLLSENLQAADEVIREHTLMGYIDGIEKGVEAVGNRAERIASRLSPLLPNDWADMTARIPGNALKENEAEAIVKLGQIEAQLVNMSHFLEALAAMVRL